MRIYDLENVDSNWNTFRKKKIKAIILPPEGTEYHDLAVVLSSSLLRRREVFKRVSNA